MMPSFRTVCLLLAALCLPCCGCIVVCGTCWNCDSHRVWVEETEELEIALEGVEAFAAQVHNGSVHAEGQAGITTAKVVVHKKAGGRDEEEAQACMDALRVKSQKEGSTHRVTTECVGPRKSHWSWSTDYELQLPQTLALEAVTHNGEIAVDGLRAGCDLETHNGKVRLKEIAGDVRAVTHNGAIAVQAVCSKIELTTHNGGIEAELRGVKDVQGQITTHNGSVELALGEAASTRLNCRTHNGQISSELALADVVMDRRSLRGKLGEGGGELEVTTHNGSIELNK